MLTKINIPKSQLSELASHNINYEVADRWWWGQPNNSSPSCDYPTQIVKVKVAGKELERDGRYNYYELYDEKGKILDIVVDSGDVRTSPSMTFLAIDEKISEPDEVSLAELIREARREAYGV